MSNFLLIFFIVLSILTLAYVLLISFYTYGWISLKKHEKTSRNFSTSVSIIVPARNEEKTIIPCLSSLIAQDYPKNILEIILIDDSSTDKTSELVKDFIKNNSGENIKYLKLSDNDKTNSNKKQAISYGIKNSSGSLIITTDADCISGEKWISSIVDYYENHDAKMIVSPVVFKHEKSFLRKLQSLEFMSLISSSSAAINLRKPIMCNGANLAYEKEAFVNINGFEANKNYASGDDIFLLLEIKKHFGRNSIQFLKNQDAIIYTEAVSTIKEFINQRIRWISKSKAYKDFGIISVALIIFLFNFGIVAALIAGIFFSDILFWVLFMFCIKVLIDFPILFSFSKFIKQRKLLWYYLPLQLIYVFYITIFGIIGNIIPYNWKGRKINN